MRAKLSDKLEAGRLRSGAYRSPPGKIWGAFDIQGPTGRRLGILSSGRDVKGGWEHVSVSADRSTPSWEEMCFVKNLFWEEEECVMQLHPPKSTGVNFHPYCLHMWRPLASVGVIPMPDPIMVGPLTTDDGDWV